MNDRTSNMGNMAQESVRRSWCHFTPLPMPYYAQRPRMIRGVQTTLSGKSIDVARFDVSRVEVE